MANFGPSKTWTDGEILSHTDLNAALLDIINNVTNNNIDADNIDETDDYTWSGANSFTGGHSIKVLSNAASSIVTGTTLEWDPGDGGQMTDNSSGISLDFKLPDASDNQDVFASIAAICLDDAAGSEDGELSFRVATAGTNTEKMTLSSTALTVTPAITASGGITGSVTSSNVSITGGSITGITDIAIADGGTGASTAAAARTNLGLEIGVDVQAYDAELQALSGLTPTDSNIIVGNGSTFVTESGATARTSLGLGSIATQSASAVSITGGSLTGMTSYSGGTISGTTGTYTGALSAQTLTANNGALYLDDNGTHNGLINVPASLFLNIDSDNGATNEKFQIAKDRSGSSGGTVLFELGEDGDLDVTGGISGTTGSFTSTISTSGGFVTVAGNPSAVAIGSNGNGQIGGLTGNGLYMYGKGSTYDLVLANANTSVALAIPTGGSATPDVYIPNSLGIGTVSPQVDLHVNNASTNGVARISTSHTSSYAQLQLVNQSGNYWYQTIVYSDNSYRLYNGSDRLIVDTSGNMGLGVTPSGYTANQLVVSAGNADGITIAASATSDVNYLLFADGTSGNAGYRGQVVYDHSQDVMQFATAAAAALTIDSSQRVGIGTTSPTSGYNLDIADSGSANVYIRTTASSATACTLKIEGYQPTSTSAYVARIEAVNRNSSETLTQIDSITDSVYNSGALVFKTASTGTVAERARILSSGGITFNGDTATANALDDYEEGSFTPSILASSVDPTISYSVRYGRYTKVGNIVTAHVKIDTSSISGGSGSIYIVGLPFSASSDSNYRAVGITSFTRSITNGGGAITLNMVNSSSAIYLFKYTDADDFDTNVTPSDFTDGTITIHGTITYEAQ